MLLVLFGELVLVVYVRVLEKLGGWFVDLSEEGKEKIALEAKKWARKE